MRFTLRAGDRERAVTASRRGDRLFLAFDDGPLHELRLLLERDGRIELEKGHRRIHTAGVVRGAERQVWANGRMLVVRSEGGRPAETPEEESLASPLPARVLEVLVQPGELVASGQKLVSLESMKTVLSIRAPRSGRVQTVYCRAGDAVAAGARLLDLGPENESAGPFGPETS